MLVSREMLVWGLSYAGGNSRTAIDMSIVTILESSKVKGGVVVFISIVCLSLF